MVTILLKSQVEVSPCTQVDNATLETSSIEQVQLEEYDHVGDVPKNLVDQPQIEGPEVECHSKARIAGSVNSVRRELPPECSNVEIMTADWLVAYNPGLGHLVPVKPVAGSLRMLVFDPEKDRFVLE